MAGRGGAAPGRRPPRHPHPLSYTGGLRARCDICSAYPLANTFRCAACDYDECSACHGPAPPARVHPHSLTFSRGRVARCDICSAYPVTESFRCAACDYDECAACFTSVPRAPTHPHPLTLVGGLSARCDLCRAHPVPESFRCVPCDYDECTACYAKRGGTNAVDPRGAPAAPTHPHALTLVGGLSARCDLCNARPLPESFRCAPCNYDECATCYAKRGGTNA